MRLLKQLAALVFWFSLWVALPAALLYPLALWMEKHTSISEKVVEQSYLIAVAVLFLPLGFLLDFLYGRFVRDRMPRNQRM